MTTLAYAPTVSRMPLVDRIEHLIRETRIPLTWIEAALTDIRITGRATSADIEAAHDLIADAWINRHEPKES